MKDIKVALTKAVTLLGLLLISLILFALGKSCQESANSTDKDIGGIYTLVGIVFLALVICLVGYEVLKWWFQRQNR
jgi:membrane protein DedA with SNARE-associated domain